MNPVYDHVVIGGGIYGCWVALELAQRKVGRVLLLEKNERILEQASFQNQARLHRGYHYPRSFLTASRSNVTLDRFIEEFRDCVEDRVQSYYAIASHFSKVTASEFYLLCNRAGLPIQKAPVSVQKLFSSELIEEVFEVKEPVFNADQLRMLLEKRLQMHGVQMRMPWKAHYVEEASQPVFRLVGTPVCEPHSLEVLYGRNLWICNYGQLNEFLTASFLNPLPLQMQWTEMALVEPPSVLQGMGMTVMDGAFFSFLPFPPRNLYSLSHVRFTPHSQWQEKGGNEPHSTLDSDSSRFPRRSVYGKMIHDAQRYLPILNQCQYRDSLWERKVTLQESTQNDGRPIVWVKNHGFRNVHCILGGKVDNIFELSLEFDLEFRRGKGNDSKGNFDISRLGISVST